MPSPPAGPVSPSRMLHVLDAALDQSQEVKAVEQALKRSSVALAESEAALAASRSAERTASLIAMHDPMTVLPNRTLFDDGLVQAIAGA